MIERKGKRLMEIKIIVEAVPVLVVIVGIAYYQIILYSN